MSPSIANACPASPPRSPALALRPSSVPASSRARSARQRAGTRYRCHVLERRRREAGPTKKPRSVVCGRGSRPATRAGPPCPDRPAAPIRSTLRHQDAVDSVERHGRPPRCRGHQVDRAARLGSARPWRPTSPRPQLRAQREHHVEDHRRRRAPCSETRVGQIRVDDHGGGRQLATRQVVVGHDHVDAAGVRRRHAGSSPRRCHGDDQVGRTPAGRATIFGASA